MNKGIIITGPTGSGKTYIAEAIANTHSQLHGSIIQLENEMDHLPHGLNMCNLVIIDKISTTKLLSRLFFSIPNQHRYKFILVTQLPKETIHHINGHENWLIIETSKK